MIQPVFSQNNLFSRGMIAVLVAQFISAFSDNALLFVAIALLKSQFSPDWQLPLLQDFFAISFIVLAPFVGPFADALPKGRVMLIANTLKFLGVSAMMSGMHPLLAYGMVGIGAAAYSPAKYGILSELVNVDKLVKANSMMEGSTIVAILLGALLGGVLADHSVHVALVVVAVCYLAAAGANLLIPKLKPMHPISHFTPGILVRDFLHALRSLIGNRDARFSIIGTGIFWGAGATMRFLLIAWVPVALGITDNGTPATLSGFVAIGIAIGAAGAARFVNLQTINRALPAGLLIGVLIMLFGYASLMSTTVIALILIGVAGGFYVVPLNALLQECGHETVGSGHAIAVQNFFENCFMISMISFYTLMEKTHVPVMSRVTILGVLVLSGIGLLSWWHLRNENG